MKKTVVFVIILILTMPFVACSSETNTTTPTTAPTLVVTDPPTPLAIDSPAPSQAVEDTVFTRDISVEEKKQAVKQIYETTKQNFAAWNTFTFDDWKAAYQPALDLVLETDNIFDFYMELKRFVVLLNDEHTQVEFPQTVYDDLWLTPIHISYLDEGYYITSGDANALQKVPQFSKIVKIDGVQVDTYMEQNVFPYVWHAKKNTVMGYYGSDVACYGQANTTQELEVITPENTTLTVSIKRIPYNEYGSNWIGVNTVIDAKQEDIFSSNLLTVKRIDDKFIYVQIKTFVDSNIVTEFEAQLDILKHAKGIILDVRYNGGGNSMYAAQIAQHFIVKTYPDLYVERSVYDINTDSYTLQTQMTTDHPGLGDITAPVMVLQRFTTGSSAEHFLDFMSHAQNTQSIGTESAGATGDWQAIDLPQGGSAHITYNKIARSDKTPFLNIGIQPDIFVDNTIRDYIDGYDAILDYSLNELKKMCKE